MRRNEDVGLIEGAASNRADDFDSLDAGGERKSSVDS